MGPSMKFTPLYERVLVQVMESQKSIGEFLLPDNAREDCLIGTVLAVGDGYRKENGELVPLLVQKDWVVVFGQYAGSKVRINGQEYLEMREGEIHGRIEE